MSRAPNVALFAALQSHDQGEQLAALRSLKNDIVGHVQKKEKWIEAGVLEPVVKILNNSRSATSHRRNSQGYTRPSASGLLSADEDVRSQALQVLASFANGTLGTQFLKTTSPLCHALILCFRRWLCLPDSTPCSRRPLEHTVQYITTREPLASRRCCPESCPQCRRGHPTRTQYK